jgi:transcriptional regulator with XRE-family HTH domain
VRKSKQHTELVLKALGDAIRNRRIDLALTQHEVATTCCLHRTYVTDIENGLRNLSFLTLMRLSKALRCPLSQIIVEKERIIEQGIFD